MDGKMAQEPCGKMCVMVPTNTVRLNNEVLKLNVCIHCGFKKLLPEGKYDDGQIRVDRGRV